MKQKTLKGSFSLFGKGLHTGLNLTVTFNPAPENSGYKIKRIDLEGEPIIDAIAENVIDTQRGTVLGKGDARVSTVEHGLAALYALGILGNIRRKVRGYRLLLAIVRNHREHLVTIVRNSLEEFLASATTG